MSVDTWLERLGAVDFVDGLSSKPGPHPGLVDVEVQLSSGERASLWLRADELSSALVMFSRYTFESVPGSDVIDLLKALAVGDFVEARAGRRWRIETTQPNFSAFSRG
jgi:hypothetical protein